VTNPITVECDFHFKRRDRGARKVVEAGAAPTPPTPGRVARVARLMALAIRLGDLLERGGFECYGEIAELGHVSKARVSQVLSLLSLAPDIQEAVLELPRVEHGRDPIILADVLSIAAASDWTRQRHMWRHLYAQAIHIDVGESQR
jgi:hypothetical protein